MTPTRTRTHSCIGALASAASVAALLAALLLAARPACAAPDEIRVVTDDLTDPGDLSLELHAASVRARSGATSRHFGQGLVELSYGLAEHWEVSLQLPVSTQPGWRANGANIELQYVAPHDAKAGPYWGARMEIGRTRAALEPLLGTALELRPIVGYRVGRWHAVLNLGVRSALSGKDHKARFEPAAKLAGAVAGKTQLGVELYSQAAEPPDGADPGLARRKLALLVVDTQVRGVDLSLGVGRGMGAAADGPVLKFIAGFEL